MNGRKWFDQQHACNPDFLKNAYGALPFTDANDTAVAEKLKPFAALAGVTLTGEMVSKARHAAGLKRRSVPRRASGFPTSDEVKKPETEVQPELPGMGVDDSLARALWALNGAVRELLPLVKELVAARRAA